LCLSIFSMLGPAAVYWYGGLHAIAGIISVGTIIAFVAYLANLYRPVAQLADVYVSLQGALAVFQRIYEYMDRTPDVEDAPEALELAEVKGHLDFSGVSFEYPRVAKPVEQGEAPEDETDRRALRDVTFEVLPGQRRRQDDHHIPAAALLRPHGRSYHPRWA
jgi:ATP-binding cassette subfamily B protein